MLVLGGHGPASVGLSKDCVDHISFSMADFICLFNEEFFPSDTLGDNLLLFNKATTDYRVGPSEWRDTY